MAAVTAAIAPTVNQAAAAVVLDEARHDATIPDQTRGGQRRRAVAAA